MKIGRVSVALLALIFGISAISGMGEDTQAAARLSRSNDQSPDGSNLPLDFQFIGQGRITGGSEEMWLIGDVPIRVDGHTRLGNDLRAGAFVALSGRISENQLWLADSVELAQKGDSFFTFNSPLVAIDSDIWRIGDHALLVNAQTVLDENLAPGELVLVTFTVLNSGQWLALEIKAFDRFPLEPTPTPTPTPIQAPASTAAVVSESSRNAKAQEGKEKKHRDSKGKKDSKSRGKGKGRGKNKR